MALWIYLVLIGFSLCYLWIKKRYSYWTDKGFISAPASFPFGTIKGVGTEITNAEGHDIFYKKYKGKGPVVGTYIFLQPVLLTTDPEFMKNILVRDFTSFHDRGFYYNKESDPLSAKYVKMRCNFKGSIFQYFQITAFYHLRGRNGENVGSNCRLSLHQEK